MTTRPASSPLPAPPATGVAAAEPIRIGVASDLHVSRLDDIKARTFVRALRFFDRSGVDAVVVPGDLADNGRVCELEMVKAAWDAVFPANRGGDGRPVEPVFLYGNHDHEGWTYEPDVRRDDAGRPVPPADALVLDMAGHWERVFGEPYATVSRKVVKGWTFVCGQYEGWGTAVQEKVRTWLEEHDAEVRGDRPFFYVQHVHPKGTVATLPAPPGGRVVCHLGETLARYPNAICLSGHSHGVLTDEAMFCWHGEYVALEGSSLKFGSTRVGRENTFCGGDWNPQPTPQMDRMETHDGAAVLLIRADAAGISVARIDVETEEPLGDEWRVAFPLAPQTGKEGAALYPCLAGVGAPAFPPGAAVATALVDGHDRAGRPRRQVAVTFPSAQAAKARALDYEVECEVDFGGFRMPAQVKRVLSPKYHRPRRLDAGPVTCPFAVDELPRNRTLRFKATPISCSGRRGETLVSEDIVLR